jgi:hypothetical protein
MTAIAVGKYVKLKRWRWPLPWDKNEALRVISVVADKRRESGITVVVRKATGEEMAADAHWLRD